MATEEDKYFKQQEIQRRIAKRRELERAAKEAQERRKVAASLATDDEALVSRIRDLGFDGDTARVLDVLPLIHVAWADGDVSQSERASILQVLEVRGIAADSEAFTLVETLLEERPSEAFLSETLHLLRDLGGDRHASIIELSMHVASASGGFFGFGHKVSEEERAVVAKIIESLGENATSTFKKSL